MGFLECASQASVCRGYEYYRRGRVAELVETGENCFTAKVSGSSNARYTVELQLDHPRKSTCDCPHANGKRIVCKHLVAAYFAVLPAEADRYHAEVMVRQEQQEEQEEELADRVCRYVDGLRKSELQNALLQLLFSGPEWQYDRFIRENGLEDE